ncbi:MAG: NAD(P)/FAD-dependent oxidoreductase [Nitrospirota bacterium]
MESPGFILNLPVAGERPQPEQNTLYDMLIVGGGPAAMSAVIYAARKMLTLALITIDLGGLIRETTEIENYLGFQSVDAKDLVARFEEHIRSFPIPIQTGAAVHEIRKEGEEFLVLTESGERFSGRTVLFATGARHRELPIPGGKEFIGRGVSYCATCDAPFFKDKPVIIVGGANSAFTTALDLMRVNATITMINIRDGWQADETLQQRVRRHDRVQFLDNHEITRIEGTQAVKSAVIKNLTTGQERSMQIDGVFVEIGLVPNSAPVKNLAALNGAGEVIIDCSCHTSIPGLFSAGDVTSVPHKQIIVSAGDGAKAALSAYDYLVETAKI